MSLVMLFAFLASLALPLVAVVGVVAYIQRTRQLRDAMRDGSPQEAVLDSLDQVHVRLDAMSDRLIRLEETLRLGQVSPQQLEEPEGARKASLGEGGSPR